LLFLAVCSAVWEQKDELRFKKFIKDFGKQYASEAEYTERFGIFKENLRRIWRLNREQPLALYGIDRFSDMTYDEFQHRYLMTPFAPSVQCQWPYHRIAAPEPQTTLPTAFDWRNQTVNPVTGVKNQLSCGSCWAFSTSGNVEGQWALSKHPLTSLSEQWSVDCSVSCLQSEPELCNAGCNGGLPWIAYEDIITNGYLPTEAAYPYTGEDGTCQTVAKTGAASISNWTAMTTDVTQIETYLVAHGPLSITLNAALLFSYTGGIITGTAASCPGDESDHAVLLVGYGVDTTSKVHYWTIKNSWDASWGEQGYFRMESSNGLCGITACVTSSIF